MTADPSPAFANGVMATVIVIWGLGPPITKLISAPAARRRVGALLDLGAAGVDRHLRHRAGASRREVLGARPLAGALFGINLAFVFSALQHSSVAVLSVIQTLQPGIVLLVAGRWLGERATRWHIGWTAVGVGRRRRGHPRRRSRRCAATSLGRRLRRGLDADVHRLLPDQPAGPVDDADQPDGVDVRRDAVRRSRHHADRPGDVVRRTTIASSAGVDWLYLLFVAVVVGIVGHTMMSWAHRFIPAARSSLFLLAMNVVAIGAAWPIHDEPVTLVQAVGRRRRARRRRRRAQPPGQRAGGGRHATALITFS